MIAPRAMIVAFRRHGAGGFNDFLLLLLLLAVGLQLPLLGRVAWMIVDVSVTTGAMLGLQVLARLAIVPLGAVLVGAVVLKALTHRTPATRHLDVAALCALPALALQLLASVLAVLVPQLYHPLARQVVLGLGALWFAGLLLLARSVALQRETETKPAEESP